MTLNLIAMLLSFAMMLTGAGADGQPAEAARSLVLRNVNVAYNGEVLRLAPEARVGVSTDGQKAVFDFGVDVNGEALLPVQVGVSEAGVTALFAGSDTAVTVPAEAIEAAMANANQQMNDALAQAQGENPELVSFLTDEFLPAYVGILKVAADPQSNSEIGERVKAVLNERIDRGEGVPAQAEALGETYDVTAYSYTLEGAQLAELVDALYAATPELKAYYDALFKLYALLPEESGLNGIDSFAALFDRFGLEIRMDIQEQLTEDGQLDITDAVITMNPPAAAAEAEGMDTGLNQPLVMTAHTLQLGDYQESTAKFVVEEAPDGEAATIEMTSARDGSAQQMDMTITTTRYGEKESRHIISVYTAADDEGGASYSASYRCAVQDKLKLDSSFYGMRNPDGTSENSVDVTVRTPEANVEVAFDLDVTDDAIEDRANGHAADFTIDDLSPEGLQALNEDGQFGAAMMKVLASLNGDVFKLTQDAGVQKLMALENGGQLPIDVDDVLEEELPLEVELDGEDDGLTYEIEDEGMEGEYGYDEDAPEDDGALPFEQPSFSWLPQGWTVTDTTVDTAYDWVELLVADGEGQECLYALFFSDPEAATTSYTVAADGTLLEGRGLSVTDFGEDGLSVTLRDGDMTGNLMFTSAAIDVETLGKIVAGVEF